MLLTYTYPSIAMLEYDRFIDISERTGFALDYFFFFFSFLSQSRTGLGLIFLLVSFLLLGCDLLSVVLEVGEAGLYLFCFWFDGLEIWKMGDGGRIQKRRGPPGGGGRGGVGRRRKGKERGM